MQENKDLRITIPKEVLFRNDLIFNEKILISLIFSEKKEFNYSNNFLTQFFNLTNPRISQIISSLEERGFITRQLFYKTGTNNVEKRILSVNLNNLPEYNQPPKPKTSKIGRKTYLILDKITGLYKIGRSKNPNVREKTLLSQAPKLKLLYICSVDIEKTLHTVFSDKIVRGEWFKLNEDDLSILFKIFNSHK